MSKTWKKSFEYNNLTPHIHDSPKIGSCDLVVDYEMMITVFALLDDNC